MVTVAPGISAALESVTWPIIAPRGSCALASHPIDRAAMSASTKLHIFRMMQVLLG
jgi:hypothetical protein